MDLDPAAIPAELARLLGAEPRLEQPFQGFGGHTYRVSSAAGTFILKVTDDRQQAAAFAAEQRVLHQLAAYRPFVPEPLGFVFEGDRGYALLSALPGRNLVEESSALPPAETHTLAAQFGWTLRRIHGWQTNLPQAADWLTAAVDRAARHVEAGSIARPVAHHGTFFGADPREMLAEVCHARPSLQNDLVFSHGDYCLPNALRLEGTVSGVIDWAHGGYADRRFDLATGMWTIRYNLREETYVRTFLDAYGYSQPVETLRPFEALYILT